MIATIRSRVYKVSKQFRHFEGIMTTSNFDKMSDNLWTHNSVNRDDVVSKVHIKCLDYLLLPKCITSEFKEIVHPLYGTMETSSQWSEKWNILSTDVWDNFDRHVQKIFFVSRRTKSEIKKVRKGCCIITIISFM